MSRWKRLPLLRLSIGAIGGLLGVSVTTGLSDEVPGTSEGASGASVGNPGVCLLRYLANILSALLGENPETKGAVKHGYRLNQTPASNKNENTPLEMVKWLNRKKCQDLPCAFPVEDDLVRPDSPELLVEVLCLQKIKKTSNDKELY